MVQRRDACPPPRLPACQKPTGHQLVCQSPLFERVRHSFPCLLPPCRAATLFVVGSYHIGKERAYLGAAQQLGWRVHAPPQKQKVGRQGGAAPATGGPGRAAPATGGPGWAAPATGGPVGGTAKGAVCDASRRRRGAGAPARRRPEAAGGSPCRVPSCSSVVRSCCHLVRDSPPVVICFAAPLVQLLRVLGLPAGWLDLLTDSPEEAQVGSRPSMQEPRAGAASRCSLHLTTPLLYAAVSAARLCATLPAGARAVHGGAAAARGFGGAAAGRRAVDAGGGRPAHR